MRILVTCFELYGKERLNSAIETLNLIKDKIKNVDIIKAMIPVVFYKSVKAIEELIVNVKPDVVICLGQAGGRKEITVERVAINIIDAKSPDNENNKITDKPIYEDGANAYFSNLPVKAMVKEMNNNLIPASVSYTGGTFVCNHTMYGLLYLINKKYRHIKGGFIHVPFIPKQTLHKKGLPSMCLASITRGIECAIKTILVH
ncbi:pyroglutamyl-peptidase I [Clostridiaceae bacterium M8S5]|nr:pyroglutamyl-peptidase I [Clostridiaceae bacterium M8S5]